MPACEITLQELLTSRDQRRAMQQQLLSKYPKLTLVVLTVVMPGAVKQTRSATIVADAARIALNDTFCDNIKFSLVRDLKTGFEMYLCVETKLEQAKALAVGIEDTHPLGRLMDIDILDSDGVPVSRGSQRACLLCGRPARECMRSGAHSTRQLLQHIDHIADEYLLRP